MAEDKTMRTGWGEELGVTGEEAARNAEQAAAAIRTALDSPTATYADCDPDELFGMAPEIAPPGYACHITFPADVKQIRPGVWRTYKGYDETFKGNVVIESHWHGYVVEPLAPMINTHPGAVRAYLVCQHIDGDGTRCGNAMFPGSIGVAIGARMYVQPQPSEEGR